MTDEQGDPLGERCDSNPFGFCPLCGASLLAVDFSEHCRREADADHLAAEVLHS